MALKRRRQPTAAEFVAELNADPVYRRKVEKIDEALRLEDEALRRAEAPLLEDLKARAGITVGSAWELANSSRPYREAIPVLFEHLHREYPRKVLEGIAFALAVPEARFGWDTLVGLFEADPDRKANGLKWAIGCALAAAADDSVLDKVVDLVQNPKHGQNRAALFYALERSRKPKARAALLGLRNDPELAEAVHQSLRGRFEQ